MSQAQIVSAKMACDENVSSNCQTTYGKNTQKQVEYFCNNIQISRDLQKTPCNLFVDVLCSNHSNGNVTGNHTEIVSDNQTGVQQES